MLIAVARLRREDVRRCRPGSAVPRERARAALPSTAGTSRGTVKYRRPPSEPVCGGGNSSHDHLIVPAQPGTGGRWGRQTSMTRSPGSSGKAASRGHRARHAASQSRRARGDTGAAGHPAGCRARLHGGRQPAQDPDRLRAGCLPCRTASPQPTAADHPLCRPPRLASAPRAGPGLSAEHRMTIRALRSAAQRIRHLQAEGRELENERLRLVWGRSAPGRSPRLRSWSVGRLRAGSAPRPPWRPSPALRRSGLVGPDQHAPAEPGRRPPAEPGDAHDH